jgi:dATP pyrophosphohydrolase
MPYNVHIYPYKKANGDYLFAIFRRSDFTDVWQGICGGGESGESIADAALRECREEGNILLPGTLYPLDTKGCMRSDVFPEWTPIWGKETLILPMYHFAMPFAGEISISEEHTEFCWLRYEEAAEKIRFADQSLALWELNRRLSLGIIDRAIPEWMTARLLPDSNQTGEQNASDPKR